MRRAAVIASLLLLAAGLGLWLARRPRAAPTTASEREPSGPAAPATRQGWLERLSWGAPQPSPADAGPRSTLRVRGRTVRQGRGVAATVHLGEGTLESTADGVFEGVAAAGADGAVVAWAEGPGLRSPTVTLTTEPRGEVWLELQPTTRLQLRVTDAQSGAPAAGATLTSPGHPPTPVGDGGRLTLAVPPGALVFTLSARGYADLETKAAVPPDGLSLELRLTRHERFAGVVVDSAGTPVPEAFLLADAVTGEDVRTRAGPNGTFELYSPAPLLLEAWRDDLLSSPQAVNTGRTDLRVVVRRACRLEVSVTLDGRPAPGAGLALSVDEDIRTMTGAERGHTDEAGRGMLGPVTCGGAGLTVDAEGHATWREQLTLEPGTTRHEVALRSGRRLEGRVVAGRTRQPIAGARVVVETCLTHTDADGHFAVTGLSAGPLEGTADADDHGSKSFTVGDEAWLDVVLDTREVRGRAAMADGAPVRQLTADDRVVFTEEGRFQFTWLAHDVELGCPGCVTARHTLPDGDVDLGDLVFRPAPLVEVTVVDPRGRPLSGASIFVDADPGFLSHRERAHPDALTDVDGRARVTAVVPGACLRALASGFSPGPRVCAPPGGPVTLTVVEGAWVTGVVRLSGRLVAGAAVAESDEDLVAVSREDGSYTLGPLAAGEHELFWLPPGVTDGFRGFRATVRVAAGERVTKDLGFAGGSRVEVLVKRGLARDIVSLMQGRVDDVLSRGEGFFQQLTPDGDVLRATFFDVTPGEWTLFVPCTTGTYRRVLQLVSDRDERVVIDAPPVDEARRVEP